MAFDLKDKVVLVTGGAIGIGARIVEILLEEGVKHVAFLDVLAKEGTERETELSKKYGDKVKYYNCDITDDNQLFGAFQSVLDKYSYIDVVINNAGIMNDSLELYKKQILVNVTALETSTFKAIELMRKDKGGKGGLVLNISSIAAFLSGHILPVYCSTKSAVLHFSVCIGSPPYYSRTGVRVVTMCFGATDTALLTRSNLSNYDTSLNEEMKQLIGNSQTPENAARGVIEACKHGESGSTWLSISNKPVKDITSHVTKSYQIFHELLSEDFQFTTK